MTIKSPNADSWAQILNSLVLFAFFWACFVRFVGLSPRFAPAAFSLPFASPSAAATAMRIADHFTTELVKGVEKRRCKYCPLSYSLRSGHGTLHDHMKSKHSHKLANDASQPAAAAAAAAAASGHGHASDADECSSITAAAPYAGGAAAASAPFSPAPSAGSKRSSSAVSSLLESQPKGAKQQTLLGAFSSSANSSLVQQTALFFATNHIAYHVADSASFRSLCAAQRTLRCDLEGRVRTGIRQCRIGRQRAIRIEADGTIAVMRKGYEDEADWRVGSPLYAGRDQT